MSLKIKTLYLLLGFLLSLSLVACSGKINPGKALGDGSSTQPPKTDGSNGNGDSTGDGDGGTGGGGDGDSGINTPPVITMINLKNGEVIPGGKVFKILFSVHDEAIGYNESKVEYQRDGDTAWKTIIDRVVSTSDQEVSVDWPVCPQAGDTRCDGQVDGGGFRIRITTKGKGTFTDTKISPMAFSIDSSSPTLSNTGLSIEPGFPLNGFIQLSLAGVVDTLSEVSDICVKTTSVSEPLSTDPCWTSLSAYGATKSLTPAAIKITYYLGFFKGDYEFYVWARDAAGNSTVMTMNNSGAGGVSKDLITVNYDYVTSPEWSHATGAAFDLNTDASGMSGSLSYNYTSAPVDNLTTLTDPGSFVVNKKGQIIVNDKTQGLVLVDLLSQTRSILVPLGAGVIEGSTGAAGTARLKNPLHIGLDEENWIWIQDEQYLLYINNSGELKIAAGGGADTNDSVQNPEDLQITYHPNMKWYGTFATLPNKQIVFTSENPHAKLNPSGGGSRFRLRVYRGDDGGRIESISFSGTYGSSALTVNDLVPYGGMAFTYDTTRKYLSSIVGRFCRENVAMDNCTEAPILYFAANGSSPVLVNTHSSWSNITFRGTLDSIYAFNSQKGLLSVLDISNKTWSKILGGSARASSYCANSTSSTSCAVRLSDVYITPQNHVFFLDLTRVRSIELDGRVQTLYSPNL